MGLLNEASTAPKCPKCKAEMSIKTRKSDQTRFWGCTRFPACNGTSGYATGASGDKQKPDDGDRPF